MKKIIERWRTPIEVVAIVVGGLFAFFTWGVDQISVRQPNWDVEIQNINETTLEYNGKIGCGWEGRVVLENRGTRPLSIHDTRIEFYLFDRPENNGIAEYTGYVYEKRIECEGLEPIHKIQIKPLDSSLIFPGKRAYRPFSVIIGSYSELYELKKEFKGKVMLVRVFQDLKVETIWGFKKKELARINVFDPSISDYGLESPETAKDEGESEEKEAFLLDFQRYTISIEESKDSNAGDDNSK